MKPFLSHKDMACFPWLLVIYLQQDSQFLPCLIPFFEPGILIGCSGFRLKYLKMLVLDENMISLKFLGFFPSCWFWPKSGPFSAIEFEIHPNALINSTIISILKHFFPSAAFSGKGASGHNWSSS